MVTSLGVWLNQQNVPDLFMVNACIYKIDLLLLLSKYLCQLSLYRLAITCQPFLLPILRHLGLKMCRKYAYLCLVYMSRMRAASQIYKNSLKIQKDSSYIRPSISGADSSWIQHSTDNQHSEQEATKFEDNPGNSDDEDDEKHLNV